jgi:hypothetical protein
METSRRNVVAAIAVAPIALTIPTLAAAGNRAQFEALFAEHQAIRAQWNAHPFSSMLHTDPGYDLLEAEDKALMYRDSDARDAIIAFPAPDHRAIIQKLDFITAEWMMDGSEASNEYLAAIKADVQRLGGVA